MILAPKQTLRPMVQNRKQRQTHINTVISYWTKAPKIFTGEKIAYSTDGAGKIGNPHVTK